MRQPNGMPGGQEDADVDAAAVDAAVAAGNAMRHCPGTSAGGHHGKGQPGTTWHIGDVVAYAAAGERLAYRVHDVLPPPTVLRLTRIA